MNEQLIKEIADAMVSSGMREAGYEYLVLDDGWMAKERSENGRLQADPEKFPNGMKAIGDYIHSKGLKFGIYECRGYLTCQRLPGSFEHEEIDMRTFSEWGVDYIKLDACYAEKNGRLTTEDLQIYKEAIEKTGRPMILSISDFGNGAWVWGGKNYGQLWRTSYDIYPWIENVYHHAETSGGDLRIHPAFNGLWQFAGPGYWNDPDMLEIGNLKSEMEDKVHMSLWCMLASPLMAGNDLRNMSDTVSQTLTASEVIAVNQDPRGHQGYKIFDNGKQIIYNKPLNDGTTAVLLFNKDTIPADITVKWDQIGLSGKQLVRDLWAEKNLGKFTDGFTARNLPEHGQYLIKVGKPGSPLIPGPDPVPEEKYIATKNGFSYLSNLYYMMKYGPAPSYDQNPQGEPIKIQGIKYEKGLSCQNGSILIYKLAGNSNRFRAMVGLDNAYKGLGTGRFRVLNEDAFGGQVLYDSGVMSKDSTAKQIDIDVRGLDCLFLKFDGKETTGNWGNARLVGSWDSHRVTYETEYIDSIIKQTELIPIRVNGDKNNRINIVIINRWEKRDERPYNNPGMRKEFLEDINRSMLAAFTPGDPAAQTAYANYQQFFNLYALWWPGIPEWRNGVETDLIDAIRDRLFLPWKNEHTAWVTFLIMPNRDGGGGGAARNLEDRVGNAVIVGNAIGKMLHEISHTCTSIGDEYTAAATGTNASPTYTASLEYERDKIKWKAWIDPETPLPTPYISKYIDKIGAFEGSQYHLTNYFRPSAQGCIMGAGVFDNTEEMCAICGQRLSMRMYTLVNPIENVSPAAKELFYEKPSTQHFSVKRVHPEPDTQEVHWILNGEIIASGIDEIDITLDPQKKYELVYTLRDTTSFILEDPPYGEFPYRERRWIINEGISDFVQIPSYTFVWTDSNPKHEQGIRYEAEKASFKDPNAKVIPYFGASEQSMLKCENSHELIEWNVNVNKNANYSIGLVYASAKRGLTNLQLWINNKLVLDSLNFPETRPLFTGWDQVKANVFLQEGDNLISLKSKQDYIINIDYLWLPTNPAPDKKITPQPPRFEMAADIKLKKLRKGGLEVQNPEDGMEYIWYNQDVPIYKQEGIEKPLSIGTLFTPEKSGNYYVGAKQISSGAESSKRIGFYYIVESVSPKTKPINPDETKTSKLLLWLDASDMNGDGEPDIQLPPRDPYKDWKDKSTGMKGPFVLYKPNQLNGKAVAGFEMVWLTNIEKPISDFQTLIMVYKESSMSFPGTSPFRDMDELIGKAHDSEKQLFTDDVSTLTKNGKTYLNGEMIDPFSHPNPMEYCILTIEFSSKVSKAFRNTQGYWEGSLAEFLVYDGILSTRERLAVEEGLRKKWFSLQN
ncbi:NPCBM/NEW2 domain-containing protein [Bacteroidota bacterium]